MEWYEIPVETLYNRAFAALGRNDVDGFKENIRYARCLLKEREWQEIHIPDDVEDVSVYCQDLDAILHMDGIYLRTLSDDILELSHFGLKSDYMRLSKEGRYKHLKDREKTLGLYKQAVLKIEVEKDRRIRVYGLDAGYWE